MDKLIYRPLAKEDYPRIKKLIDEAFGFHEAIKDPHFLDLTLNIYLQDCILSSSFSMVAEKSNEVIGIILGEAEKDKTHLRKAHNILSVASTMIKLLLSSKKNKNALKEFSLITQTYKEIMEGKKDNFQGCVQLFIVSEESRGLGIGKSLVSKLSDYMKTMDVKSLYLYTDTRCNYGFYDSQNFNRIAEKEICFDSNNEKLNIFLYSYNF
ncbi:MAG: GNAT family N-acetyltransferase [Clostridium sp.]